MSSRDRLPDVDAVAPRSADAVAPRSTDADAPRSADAGAPRSTDAGAPRSTDAVAPRSVPTTSAVRSGKRRRSIPARILAGLAWMTVGVLAAFAALRVVAHDAHFVLVAINMFSFWLYLPAYVLVPIGAASRRPVLALASSVLVAAHLGFALPGSVSATAAPGPASGPRFRFVTVNALFCNDRPDVLLRELLATRADVLVVSEHSSLWERALDSPDARRLWPHRFFHTREDAFGIGLYSRRPLESPELVDVLGVPVVRGTVTLRGRPVRVYGAHPLPPRKPDYHARWERQMVRIESILARERGPLVVGADLNASPHNAWYTRLTSGRLRGAHDDRGRGLATTWPNGLFLLPPVRIDHVLVSPEIEVQNVREGTGAGSDHRPVIADLALR